MLTKSVPDNIIIILSPSVESLYNISHHSLYPMAKSQSCLVGGQLFPQRGKGGHLGTTVYHAIAEKKRDSIYKT